MNRAAIYVRVSTSRHAERDLSLPDQIAQCRAYCERKGLDVVEVFSEPGASALDDDRPVFQEMIFKAKRSERLFDYVVVHSLSRFSRDAMHSELYVRQLKKARVQLVSITQDIGEDAGGEFIRKVLNVIDELRSRENAKHVQRPCARMRARVSGTVRVHPSAIVSRPRSGGAIRTSACSSSMRPRRPSSAGYSPWRRAKTGDLLG